MTKEKAITIIENCKEQWQMLLREDLCDETEGRELVEAFDMALSALSENRGEWISTEDRPYGFCSKCDHDIDEASTPYCPYCGAKMTWVGAIREPYKAEREETNDKNHS